MSTAKLDDCGHAIKAEGAYLVVYSTGNRYLHFGSAIIDGPAGTAGADCRIIELGPKQR